MAIELMNHQRRFVELFLERPRFAWFAEPGVGKSIGTLAAIADAKRTGYAGRTVIIAPKSVMHSAWIADSRHFPDMTTICAWSQSPAERRRRIASTWDICVLNYEAFKKHADELARAGVTRLVVDESSKIKNPTSQITRACIAFADRCDSVLLLSGTPAPNCRTEYWSQMRCVDKNVFGQNFFKFAHYFFFPQKRWINGVERVVGWRPAESKSAEFLDRLGRASWTLRKSSCIDLPPQTDVMRGVELGDEERRVYQSILDEFVASAGDGESIKVTAQGQLMKLRQATSGMIYNERGHVVTFGRSKIDELLEVLEEIGPRKCVVWAEFTSEIDAIVDAVRGSRSVATIDGRSKLADRIDAVEKFQDGDLKTLVCHPAAAGHGITLTAASYAVYFSHGFSFEAYQQSRDRIYRKGQTEPTTYYHLLADGTVDAHVWKALTRKQSSHELIMDILKSSRGSTDGNDQPRRAKTVVAAVSAGGTG